MRMKILSGPMSTWNENNYDYEPSNCMANIFREREFTRCRIQVVTVAQSQYTGLTTASAATQLLFLLTMIFTSEGGK